MPEDQSTTPNPGVTPGLPVAPSMSAALATVEGPPEYQSIDYRILWIALLSVILGALGAFVAEALMRLIGFITNITYFGRVSTEVVAPSSLRLGAVSILIPIIGAIVIGIIARYGEEAIRGDGIPEVMERVLRGRSRISPRVMFLKPITAAIAIGTGGPFGAEGPIIATGGALGSVIGQVTHMTADERKVLLAAGAAAGLAATFAAPVSAVLLAIELLLFEYRPRSIIPVALASTVAASMRALLTGSTAPIFPLGGVTNPSLHALFGYTLLGAVVGVASVFVTRVVYWFEEVYEELPVHWMWWPAIGAVVVGVIGYFAPRTLGVGYYNIQEILDGRIVGMALVTLVVLKFISWSVYLASGTSGGTLAPLFTIGGGLGALIGIGAETALPALGLDLHVAALVGMAAIFAGASQALLASIVFAFETTRQPLSLLPLLAGGTAAYLVSLFMMRGSIMTEKLMRRGAPIPTEYTADFFQQVLVNEVASSEVTTVRADDTVEQVRAWIASRAPGTAHQGFPVLDENGRLIGVVTRREVLDPDREAGQPVRELVTRPPAVAYEDNTLREAADHMVRSGVGRLPVVDRDEPHIVIGIITRSDLLGAHAGRLAAAHQTEPPTDFRRSKRKRRSRPVAKVH